MKQSRNTTACSNRKYPDIRRISSRSLLAGENHLRIEHNGVDYLLQITRQGKLILTK